MILFHDASSRGILIFFPQIIFIQLQKESITVLQKSPAGSEDASPDNQQKDTAHGNLEVSDKPHPTRKAAELGLLSSSNLLKS